MTTTTVTAGRILKGQLEGRKGEASTLAIDTMHYSGFSKVCYNNIASYKHHRKILNFNITIYFYNLIRIVNEISSEQKLNIF